MLKSLTPITLAALLAMTAPLAAQETAAEEETAGAETAEQADQQSEQQAEQGEKAESSADDILDLGEPVSTDPQLGQRYSKEKHGDWDLACIKTEGKEDPCSLLQILKDKDGNPTAEFSLFRIANGTKAVAGATVIVPLETLLPAQLTISVDGAPGKRYNYTFCNPIGCVAQIGLTEGDIAAFKRGAKATLSLRPAPAPDQVINLDMSLKGFTAGFDVVDVVKN